MNEQPLTWEQIVGAVSAHGNSAVALEAIDNDVDMPEGEVGVLEDELEDRIFVGTFEGEIELAEDCVIYENGDELHYDDDWHRETIALAVLPDFVTNHLVKA